jgi:hypothetical protein
MSLETPRQPSLRIVADVCVANCVMYECLEKMDGLPSALSEPCIWEEREEAGRLHGDRLRARKRGLSASSQQRKNRSARQARPGQVPPAGRNLWLEHRAEQPLPGPRKGGLAARRLLPIRQRKPGLASRTYGRGSRLVTFFGERGNNRLPAVVRVGAMVHFKMRSLPWGSGAKKGIKLL